MAAPTQKVSILLNGGLDEQGAPELCGPIATQGASITLRESNNTRLSPLRGTCQRAPNSPVTATLTNPIHGIVSAAAGRNSVAFSRRGLAPSVVLNETGASSGNGAGSLISPLVAGAAQNSYIPSQIVNAGAIPSVSSLCPPAVAYDATNGYYYYAFLGNPDDGSANYRVYVGVTDADGAVVAAPQAVTTQGITLWLGVTWHGASGARVWFQQNSGTPTISMGQLVLTGNVVALGGVGIVSTYTPVIVNSQVDVCAGVTINADGTADVTDANNAYIACANSVTNTTGEVLRVNVTTGVAATAAVFAGALIGNGNVAICYGKIGGARRVGVAFCSNGSLLTLAVLNSTNLVATSTGTATANAATTLADVAVQFTDTPVSGQFLIVVASTFNASLAAAGWNGCNVFTLSMSTSVVVTRGSLPWQILRSRGSVLTFSATEIYPVFDLVRYYGTASTTPLGADYVLDPSVELWLFGSPTEYTPVARYGVVRFSVAAARLAHYARLPSAGITTGGSKIYATYLKDVLGTSAQSDYPARYVVIDFAQHQPRVAQDKDGVALVAAALPVQWDGSEVVEMGGPLHAPKVLLNPSSGTGPVYPVGTYLFAVHYLWTDGGGLEHRSATTAFSWAAPGGTSPQIFCSIPDSLRHGTTQIPVQILVYVSQTNLPALYLLPDRAYSFASTYLLLPGLSTPDVSRAQVYSRGTAGEEQLPQPPPPSWDVAIVGDRCWMLDAEIRSRIVYSKHRIAGKGFEFNPAYELLLPSGAGKTVAIKEWQGTVVVFTEYAIFQISGTGPDNIVGNPSGGAFSAPIQVSSLGCSVRESVVATPKGIVFQRGEFVMLFTGGEPATLPGIQPATNITGAFLLRDYNEAVFLIGDNLAPSKTWNFELNRWTSWDIAGAYSHALAYDTSKVLVYDDLTVASPNVRLLSAYSTSTALEMSWATDWIVLGGDFQDSILLRHVLFSARRLSAHGIKVEVFTNYETTTNPLTYSVRTYTAAMLTALPGNSRYTLRVSPKRQDTRAVKVKITETEVDVTRGGCQPVCVTFFFSVDGQNHENAMVQGSYQ